MSTTDESKYNTYLFQYVVRIVAYSFLLLILLGMPLSS